MTGVEIAQTLGITKQWLSDVRKGAEKEGLLVERKKREERISLLQLAREFQARPKTLLELLAAGKISLGSEAQDELALSLKPGKRGRKFILPFLFPSQRQPKRRV